MPLVSVVVPVYNRREELRRALRSIANQSLTDFECIVVDDCSTRPIHSVVAEFDSRFSCVRRDTNGGPTAARMTGFEHVNGDFVARLDSDNEFFPWTLDRAAHYLHTYPEAVGATGLYVFPDGFHVRVAGAVKIAGPDHYAAMSTPLGDSLGVVRRSVIDEWLQLRRDYYATELVFWLTLRFVRSHPVVLVDEPWGRYHTDGAHRVTAEPLHSRELEDIRKFVSEFRPILGATPCGPVDTALIHMWIQLARAHRFRDAAAVADWMHERGISRLAAVRRKVAWSSRQRISSRLPRARPQVL